MIAIILYILATVSANYLADWFIPVGSLLVSLGTITFAATFTLRDHIHQRGRRVVYSAIATAAVVNVVVAVVLGISWRIIGASFLSICVAESADTEMYQRLLHRSWIVRVLSSNAVSIPIDTIVFTLLAFAGLPDFPVPVLLAIIAGDMTLKFLIAGAIAVWRPRIPVPHTTEMRY